MIAIGPACAGQPTRDRHVASYLRTARSLGRREVRRQHPRRDAHCGDFDGGAGPPPPDWRPSRSTIVILVAILLLVPRPGAVQLRDWATSVGPWFPLAFLAAHIVVTVFPFPRTAFTLAVGTVVRRHGSASPIAVVASTVSALLALLLVRAAGWRLDRLVPHPRVATPGRPAAPARLADGHVDAVDPGRPVLGAQLRCGRVGRAGAALHAGRRWSACCPAPPRSSSSATRSPTTSARC